MTRTAAEIRLLGRSRFAMAALALLFALSALAVVSGLATVARQRAAITRVAAEQARDHAAVVDRYGTADGEAGNAAYYSFLLTHDAPPRLAFAAIGQRDIQPFVLRVRALGLQQQLYDAESVNAELVLPGVFDWAFVTIYLAPLVVIALSHDLVTGERESGRLRLLLSMADAGLWRRRVALRLAAVLVALALPLVVAAIGVAAPLAETLAMVGVAALYLGVWFGLAMLVAATVRTSAGSAAALVGCWIALTLVIPALANSAITRAVPIGRGIDLTLAQREIVHRGWDIPKPATFDRFFVNHPQWRGREGFEGRFHWKWLFAMHQVGDEAVAPQVTDYRARLAAREGWTGTLGMVLPSVGAQAMLHRLADTDLSAQLAYQDSIGRFHARLRQFFYPYLFTDTPFTRADFARLPRYTARAPGGGVSPHAAAALSLAAALLLTWGGSSIARVGTFRAPHRQPTTQPVGAPHQQP